MLAAVNVISLGYRTDLMLRELEGSTITDRGDYLVIRSPAQPGFWWGNFLLLARPPGPGEARGWLARFAAEFPAAGHVALGIDGTDAAAVDVAGLVAEGLHYDHSTVMTASAVHEPPRINMAATFRPLTGDDDWQQAAGLRAACYGGEPGFDQDFIIQRAAAERALTEAGHGAWFGAFIDGRLLAQLGLICRDGLARYQNVETHPAARRQGLAGTLVWQAGQHGLTGLGARTLVMVADPDEAAIRLYRSVGFADSETQIAFERQPPASPDDQQS
jgi:ribosomal protein S18 acetylase RimI-like enzyme